MDRRQEQDIVRRMRTVLCEMVDRLWKGGDGMTIDEIQKECEKRALALIEQGVKLREIDMRIIVRQVLKEAMEGNGKEK